MGECGACQAIQQDEPHQSFNDISDRIKAGQTLLVPSFLEAKFEQRPHGRLWIRLDDLQTAVANFLTRLD